MNAYDPTGKGLIDYAWTNLKSWVLANVALTPIRIFLLRCYAADTVVAIWANHHPSPVLTVPDVVLAGGFACTVVWIVTGG